MNLAFWTEAHKRARKLLKGVVQLDSLAQEGRMSEVGLLFDRLRLPSEEFRDHCLTRGICCGSSDLVTALLGVACLKVSLDGWRMFCINVHRKDFSPTEFISAWHYATRGTVDLLLKKCKSEAAETN